jgi:TPP-dependent pyruvate/acetoin dehydrogenase alpha subunit
MGSKIPAEVLLEMYRKMLLIRRFEERAIELYSERDFSDRNDFIETYLKPKID